MNGNSSSKNVFVGNLSWLTNNEDLYQYLSKEGRVISVEVQRYEDTHRSKGWA
jgi:RNA recognition motif-containing protein